MTNPKLHDESTSSKRVARSERPWGRQPKKTNSKLSIRTSMGPKGGQWFVGGAMEFPDTPEKNETHKKKTSK